MKPKQMPVMPVMCATCPWRGKGASADLLPYLSERATVEGRICHSTGRNELQADLGAKNYFDAEHLCRGARNQQIIMFYEMGFLPEATDAAWAAKCAEMRIKMDTHSTKGED